MKQSIIIAITILISSFSFGQNTARLTGQITNPTGDSVFLYTYQLSGKNYNKITIDKAALNEAGKFVMTTKVDSITEMTFSDGNENAPVILSPNDKINMTLNTSYFDETINYSGKGSEKNNAIMALYLIQESINNTLINGIDGEDTSALFVQYDESHKKYIQLVNDYKMSVSDFDNYADNILSSSERNKKQIKNYVASEIAFNAQMKKIKGIIAIDFEGIDLKGNKTKLSDYKGKMIIVDFWATWCGPCKAEFPAYKELEEKYGKEIHFVSVAAFCKEKDWKKMATKEGFQNNIFLSEEAAKQIEGYSVSSIPRYLVIDENFILIDANAPRPSSGELPSYWKK